MKPSLPIFAYIKVEPIYANKGLSRLQMVNCAANSTYKSLTHPLRVSIRQILFTVLLLATAQSQTSIVAVRDPTRVVLAADSRISSTSSPFCKIRRCGNGFLAVSGIYDALTRDDQLFQLWPRLLETCRADIAPREQIAQLEAVGIAWLDNVLEFGKSHASSQAEYTQVREQATIGIVFVGQADQQFILARAIGNTMDIAGLSAAKAVTTSVYDYDLTLAGNTVQDVIFGHVEGLPESGERYRIYRLLGVAKGAEFFVNTTIINRPEDVAPPIDIVMIDAHGFHWLEQKPECQEKKQTPKPSPAKPRRRRKPSHTI